MKILVTGALGHIGSYLIRDIVKHFPNLELVLVDNLMTQRFCSLFDLPVIGKYKFIEADITQVDLTPLLKDVDIVIHLAAITDAAGSVNNKEAVENNNFIATERLASACAELKVRLISLSSTSVYGTQNAVVSEDCSEEELQPQSPYARTKLREERLVQKLCREKNLQAVCCRFGTIFGSSIGMRFHTAVNKFCWQAVMDDPITIWRTAYDQKRPYLDIVDAVRAIYFIIQNDLFDGEIYNVLTLNATVRDIVTSIEKYKKNLKLSFVDNAIMNQLSYEVSNRKFCSHGFVFVGSLARGIGDTMNILQSSHQR
jgi:UDP-glucose 4-epimerase